MLTMLSFAISVAVLLVIVSLHAVIEVDALVPPKSQRTPFSNNVVTTTTTTTTTTAIISNPNLDQAVIEDAYDGDENDASRRLFVTGLLGIGLLAGLDGAEAMETNLLESEHHVIMQKPVSSTIPSSTLSDAAAVATTPAPVDWKAIGQKATKRALGGGKAGASAAVVQVCSLMWLRTSMNYQYRYGGNLASSLKTLWAEGGIPRLYQGLPFALIQGPLTRFGDTAANVGILALLDVIPATQLLPLPLKTACGSVAAGLWRIILMPIDTSKTAMQVEGADGLKNLWNDVINVQKSPVPLYRGAVASAAATAVGHFPWFLTYNFLNEQIPEVSSADDVLLSLARAAFLGLCASCVSDVCSNSLRVIKTTKQTASLTGKDENAVATAESKTKELTYAEVVAMIIEKDGIGGLFGRGLQTRLLTNALQGAVFSVLWKYFQQIQS